MNYSKFLRYIIRLVVTITLLLVLSLMVLAQQRRFGLDEPSTKDKKALEETTPRRYLPTESNHRFGLQPGESELETRALPIVLERPKSLLKVAQQLAANGQLEQAVISYKRAIATKESLGLAHFGLGHTLMKLGRFDDAIKSFREAIIIIPNKAELQLNLGVALHSIGEINEAITCYKRAIEIGKGQFADADFNLALALFHQGEFTSAIEHYQNAIQIRKIYPAAYNNLGLAYEAINNFEAASTNFQLAVKQSRGNYPLAHYNLGRFYFNQGKFFPQAVNQLELAIKTQNNFPEALLILGNIYLIHQIKTGELSAVEKAKVFYKQAINLRPSYHLAHENLAIAHSRSGEKKEAFSEYRIAFNLSKKYSSFLLENVIFTITNKESFFINDEFSRAEAPKAFKQNIEQLDENKEVITDLLNNYEQLPEELKALSDIRYCFGKVYISIGNWNKATDELTLAIELSNGNDTEAKDLLKSIYQLIL